jgi:hypothetical protein
MKQVAKDLRVVEYDYHRGDGVPEREYKAMAKRITGAMARSRPNHG